jgi:cytochrome c553
MKAMIFRRLAALLALLVLSLAAAESLAQNVSNGQSLFQQFCQPCHGNPPVGGAAGAGNNPGLIRDAINGKVPDMRDLRFLTDQNLADIAAWIASLSAPPPPPAPDRDYTDLWYGGESESGWGFNIIQHSTNNIFGVMYTYDANGHPIWFVLPGGHWTSNTTFSGAWYRVTGTSYDKPWVGNDVRQVGTATISFSDASHGTLTFIVNGAVVSKSIQRQPF